MDTTPSTTAAPGTDVRPFTIDVPEEQLADLEESTARFAEVADFLEEYFTGCEGAEGLATDLDYQSLHHAAKGPLDLYSLSELDAARRLL